MGKPAEALREAIAIEGEVQEGLDAAQAEQQRGQGELSLELLIEAIRKERDSLDLLEQGVDTLRESLENRRLALDKQEELLQQFMNELHNP